MGVDINERLAINLWVNSCRGVFALYAHAFCDVSLVPKKLFVVDFNIAGPGHYEHIRRLIS